MIRFGNWELGVGDLALIIQTIMNPVMGSRRIQQDDSRVRLNKPELWKKAARSPIKSALQILVALEHCLTAEMPALHFDYFGKNERCFRLLQSIKHGLKEEADFTAPSWMCLTDH